MQPIDVGVRQLELPGHRHDDRRDDRRRLAAIVGERQQHGRERVRGGVSSQLADLERPCPADRRDGSTRNPVVVIGLGEDVGLVPAERLGRVHRRVRVADQGLHADLVPDATGDADRDGDRDDLAALDLIALALDERPQLLRQEGPFLDIGLGQDQHEFLAAVPTDHVRPAQVLGQCLGHAAQHHVTDPVAVCVVDGLEVIDIHERDRKRALVARRAHDLGEELGQECLSIRYSGQPVERRPIVGVRQGARDVVHGDGHAALETDALRGDLDRVVARGDLLGGLDQARESEPEMRPDDEGGERHADGAGRDRGEHRPDALIDPRDQGIGHEQGQGPDRDRSRERQDPD